MELIRRAKELPARIAKSGPVLWGGLLGGVVLTLWSLRWQIAPIVTALKGLVFGEESGNQWANDRAAAALYEASREVARADPAVAKQYADLSELARKGSLTAPGTDAATILVMTAGMINSQVAPMASARLRHYMAVRGISWKSGGTEVTEEELEELEDALGLRVWFPPILHPKSMLIGLTLLGLTGYALTRNGIRKARKNSDDKRREREKRRKNALQALGRITNRAARRRNTRGNRDQRQLQRRAKRSNATEELRELMLVMEAM